MNVNRTNRKKVEKEKKEREKQQQNQEKKKGKRPKSLVTTQAKQKRGRETKFSDGQQREEKGGQQLNTNKCVLNEQTVKGRGWLETGTPPKRQVRERNGGRKQNEKEIIHESIHASARCWKQSLPSLTFHLWILLLFFYILFFLLLPHFLSLSPSPT